MKRLFSTHCHLQLPKVFSVRAKKRMRVYIAGVLLAVAESCKRGKEVCRMKSNKHNTCNSDHPVAS